MRFAVHWPGCPVASPRSHGVPRRDILSRVHVSVAGETAGSAPEHGLALTRVPVRLPVAGYTNTLSDTADISGEVKRRFRPGLKAGVWSPQF